MLCYVMLCYVMFIRDTGESGHSVAVAGTGGPKAWSVS